MAIAMLLMISMAALAHEKPVKGTHGGQLLDVNSYHWELVAVGGELTLHVSDAAEQPVSTNGAKATATVLSAGKALTVEMMAAEPNILKGKGDFVATKGLKVVVSVSGIGDKPAQIRFTPLE
ncbi:MAG: hypothetical protein F9K44_09020 [Hyphomicrobiaceae bacterium]|nr:MAG: hypothetical protein F9K44_09020 [Hyphomicrobiaceae bacterium]